MTPVPDEASLSVDSVNADLLLVSQIGGLRAKSAHAQAVTSKLNAALAECRERQDQEVAQRRVARRRRACALEKLLFPQCVTLDALAMSKYWAAWRDMTADSRTSMHPMSARELGSGASGIGGVRAAGCFIRWRALSSSRAQRVAQQQAKLSASTFTMWRLGALASRCSRRVSEESQAAAEHCRSVEEQFDAQCRERVIVEGKFVTLQSNAASLRNLVHRQVTTLRDSFMITVLRAWSTFTQRCKNQRSLDTVVSSWRNRLESELGIRTRKTEILEHVVCQHADACLLSMALSSFWALLGRRRRQAHVAACVSKARIKFTREECWMHWRAVLIESSMRRHCESTVNEEQTRVCRRSLEHRGTIFRALSAVSNRYIELKHHHWAAVAFGAWKDEVVSGHLSTLQEEDTSAKAAVGIMASRASALLRLSYLELTTFRATMVLHVWRYWQARQHARKWREQAHETFEVQRVEHEEKFQQAMSTLATARASILQFRGRQVDMLLLLQALMGLALHSKTEKHDRALELQSQTENCFLQQERSCLRSQQHKFAEHVRAQASCVRARITALECLRNWRVECERSCEARRRELVCNQWSKMLGWLRARAQEGLQVRMDLQPLAMLWGAWCDFCQASWNRRRSERLMDCCARLSRTQKSTWSGDLCHDTLYVCWLAWRRVHLESVEGRRRCTMEMRAESRSQQERTCDEDSAQQHSCLHSEQLSTECGAVKQLEEETVSADLGLERVELGICDASVACGPNEVTAQPEVSVRIPEEGSSEALSSSAGSTTEASIVCPGPPNDRSNSRPHCSWDASVRAHRSLLMDGTAITPEGLDAELDKSSTSWGTLDFSVPLCDSLDESPTPHAISEKESSKGMAWPTSAPDAATTKTKAGPKRKRRVSFGHEELCAFEESDSSWRLATTEIETSTDDIDDIYDDAHTVQIHGGSAGSERDDDEGHAVRSAPDGVDVAVEHRDLALSSPSGTCASAVRAAHYPGSARDAERDGELSDSCDSRPGSCVQLSASSDLLSFSDSWSAPGTVVLPPPRASRDSVGSTSLAAREWVVPARPVRLMGRSHVSDIGAPVPAAGSSAKCPTGPSMPTHASHKPLPELQQAAGVRPASVGPGSLQFGTPLKLANPNVQA